MKRALIICMAAFMLAACGNKYTEKPEEDISNKYTDAETDISGVSGEDTPSDAVVYETVNDEAVIAENQSVAGAMLDCFKNLDFDGALGYVRESDREMFDVETAGSNLIYNLLPARMSYEFGESLTDEDGRRYISVDISSPSMLDIYSSVFLLMNDALINGEITADETRDFNNDAIYDVVEGGDYDYITTNVVIEFQNDADGELRTVLTPELLNAMLGDIQNASQQINEAMSESVDEYNSAKAAGEFD